MSEVFKIILLSVGSIITIFILTKLMGYRQMSQMSMFDYIIGITIGSIAAEMATSLEDSFIQPLVAMGIYALFAICLSFISLKFIKARRIIEGTPLILLNKGEIYRENLKKSKIDVSEFLMQCRINGYFDVSKLETAILEENGKISFLPKSTDRPILPSDVQLNPAQDYMVANVVLDGKVMKKNLQHSGKDEKWLMQQLKGQGADKIEDVLLATCDQSNKVTVFMKNHEENMKDVWI
ncbi:MAG TPA: DUF421 domain-containing protein [Candidatus Merdenecus merdavium]|nr:DUF421 domain-containing protein [Candidatus Merdenecus merdavium]